jgi:hypothetical protein
VFAQYDSTSRRIDQQLWMDYNYSSKLNDKLSLAGDIGLRGVYSNVDWNQLYVRPGVRYRFNKFFGLAGSLAGFFTFNNSTYNLYEIRITADANVNWPDLKIVNFSYRFRIENRTFFYQSDENKDNNFRFRFLISFNTKRFNVFSKKRFIYFQLQFEPFYTPGAVSEFEVFINQTRIHAIFGHRISPAFGYDIQYIWQRSRLSAEYDLQTTQNIVRIRFYHKITKKKAKKKNYTK